MNRFWFPPLLFLIPAVFISCKQNKKAPSVPEKKLPDIAAIKPDDSTRNKPLTAAYHFLPIDSAVISNIWKTFTPDELGIILAINRIDYAKLNKTDTLIVPDTIITDRMYYSDFPENIPLLDSVKKILFFSYRIQAFAAYENGKLVRWGPTSMGKQSTPNPNKLLNPEFPAEPNHSSYREVHCNLPCCCLR
jgi:hypothetical protein